MIGFCLVLPFPLFPLILKLSVWALGLPANQNGRGIRLLISSILALVLGYGLAAFATKRMARSGSRSQAEVLRDLQRLKGTKFPPGP